MEMSRNERFPPGKILIQNLGLVYLGFCVGLAARSPGWTVGVTTVVQYKCVPPHKRKPPAPVWHWLDQIAAGNNM